MKSKKEGLILNKKNNDQRGFTLAELLLVVGIIIILAGVSFVAASYYYKVLKLNAMDNTAKEIFIAAQNHITSAQTSGELERYLLSEEVAANKETSNADILDAANDEKALGKIMDYTPSDVKDTDIEWPEPNLQYYYIRHDDECNIDDSILQYALPSGAIDDYINTDGIYIIEYDINTASVYGVFYTEAKNKLTAETVAELDSGRGSNDDAKKVRRNHKGPGGSEIIGYYGGAMADNWRVEEAPVKLKVKNGNKKVEGWETKTHKYEKERLTAIIRDNGCLNTKEITLKVEGETSGNSALVTWKLDSGQSDKRNNGINTVAYDVDCGNGAKIKTFGTINKISGVAGDSKDSFEYQIVLDDLVQENVPGEPVFNCHFGYLFPTFIPGENVKLTAYAYGSGGSCSGYSDAVDVNSLFESCDAPEITNGERKAYISSFRHLENLDNNISAIQRKGNEYSYHDKYTLEGEKQFKFSVKENMEQAQVDFIYTQFQQTADLDWDEYYGGDNNKILTGVSKDKLGTAASRQLYESGTTRDNAVYPGTFFSIIRCDLLEYDGGGFKISDVKILNNMETSESDSYGYANGALFGYLNKYSEERTINLKGRECVIHDLTLKNFKVMAPKNTSALVGETKSSGFGDLKFQRILIDGGDVKSGYYGRDGSFYDYGSNRGNNGGLIGYSGNKVFIDQCASTATLETTGVGYDAQSTSAHLNATDTGGLAGEISGLGKFTNSYTGGTTASEGSYNENKPNIKGSYTAGGILGRSSNNETVTMINCYSTSSVYSELKKTVTDAFSEYNSYAGGLVGYKEKGIVDFRNCYSAGAIFGKEYTLPNKSTLRGALLGGGSSNYSGCYYLYYSDTVNQGLYAKGGDMSNPAGVSVISYDTMIGKASRQRNETHGINRTSAYPFVAVNKTGIENSGLSGVHYGDWPARQKEIIDNYEDLMFAYKETIEEDTYWYIVGKNNNGNYYVVKDTLPYDLNTYLDDSKAEKGNWSYGYICPQNNDGDQRGLGPYFTGVVSNDSIIEDGQKYTKKDTGIIIGDDSYVYWELENSGELGDIITTPKQNKGNTSSQFMFNRKFAACITGVATNNSGDLGTVTNPYQIRSEKQLNNINSGYLARSFHQTLNINLTLDKDDEDFVAIGVKSNDDDDGFTGTYSGLIDIPEGGNETSYSIENFSQKIEADLPYEFTSEDTGLFGRIGHKGVVSDVKIIGKSVSARDEDPDSEVIDIDIRGIKVATVDGSGDSKSVDIGGFASYNAGTVTNCRANLVISTEKADEINLPGVLVSAGGMFGSNTNSTGENGTVSNCEFIGKLLLENLKSIDAQMRIRIGAFAGRNNKLLDGCTAGYKETNDKKINDKDEIVVINVNMQFNGEMDGNRNDRIGGFIGEHRDKAVSNCSSNVDLNYNNRESARKAYVGGFVGFREGTALISQCYAYGRLHVNCAEGYTTYKLSPNSTIGKFGSNVSNNDSNKESYVDCYYQNNSTTIIFTNDDCYYTIN